MKQNNIAHKSNKVKYNNLLLNENLFDWKKKTPNRYINENRKKDECIKGGIKKNNLKIIFLSLSMMYKRKNAKARPVLN